MPDQPTKPARRRFVLCMGQHCNQGKQAEPLYERMSQELGDPGPAFMSRKPITWEIANCLSMCELGPNLVVYPEGTAYHDLDVAALERILHEYLHPEGQKDEQPG
ncbi:MAG: (2Fe-2S) ferredoxin domain-containing protein [Chloroflexi bacterium]|nr:(2Fe-2S) ferredoxin domain-containing protein [Chloroflexota bacterium]